MLNFIINKSVKTLNNGISSIVSGITAENTYKTEVDFCKFDSWSNLTNFNSQPAGQNQNNTQNTTQNNNQNLTIQNYPSMPPENESNITVLYLVHSKFNLNVYYITDDFDLKCIHSSKLSFPINSVDTYSVSVNSKYAKEVPILALISNSGSNSNNINTLSVTLSGSNSNNISNSSNINNSHNSNYNISTNNYSQNHTVTNNSNSSSYSTCHQLLLKNESQIKFYSIKSKRVVHSLRFKKKILQFISKINYFALGFADGNIKLFENENMDEVLCISTCNAANANISSNLGVGSKISSSHYVYSVPVFDITESCILYYSCSNSNSNIKLNLNNSKANSVNKHNSSGSGGNNKSNSNSNQNNINVIRIPSSPNKSTNSNQGASLEYLASEAYKNISKLKDWSIYQLKDLSNLRSGLNFKNNTELKEISNKYNKYHSYNEVNSNNNINLDKNLNHLSNNYHNVSKEFNYSESSNNNLSLNKTSRCTLILQKLNFNSDNDTKNSKKSSSFYNNNSPITQKSYAITVPFFDDGVSLIKFFHDGRYFITGNKNSQMFYVYEIFPQSNLKFTNNVDSNNTSLSKYSIYSSKIVYSFYRGVTSAVINSVDLSACKNLSVIASNKGTFHLFSIPKRDNQLLENSSNFDYENFDEINQKVTCGKDLEKIKMGSFLSNNTYKSTCKLFNHQKIDVDKHFSSEMREVFLKSKFSKTVKGTVLYTFSENDPGSIYVYLINKGAAVTGGKNAKNTKNSNSSNNHNLASPKNVYFLKKIEINSHEEIEKNLEEILKKKRRFHSFGNSTVNSAMKSYCKEHIELETTDKNFPNLHTNPLFTFNIYSGVKDNGVGGYSGLTGFNGVNNNSNNMNNSNTHTFGKRKGSFYYNSNNGTQNLNQNLQTQNSNSNPKTYNSNNNHIIEEKNEDLSISPSTSGTLGCGNLKLGKDRDTISLNKMTHLTQNEVTPQISFSLAGGSFKKPHSNSINSYYPSNLKSRSNSISVPIKAHYNSTQNYNNILSYNNVYLFPYMNDVHIHEKIICQEIDYTPRSFTLEKKTLPLKNDFFCESSGNHLHPKLIVYPNSHYVQHNKLKRNLNRINSSISDNSSSVDNSISLTGLNDSECNKDNNSQNVNLNTILKNQLKKDMESNIADSINKNNSKIVQVIGSFNIDDNYYANK